MVRTGARDVNVDAWRFISSSLRHYRRIHIAVAFGVAVATAVLAGALLVGDSMRGSLRDLTLQRLGSIDSAIVAMRMFRTQLAQEVASRPEFKKNFIGTSPAILFHGTLVAGNGKDVRRATAISAIGFSPGFWSLGDGGPTRPLTDDQAAITESVARELGVHAGDELLLQIPVAGPIPADSLLGAKQLEKISRSHRFRVAAILPPNGLARFGVAPSQQLPRNVFVPIAALQRMLNQPDKANAILISAKNADVPTSPDAEAALREALQPRLEDFGLRFDHLASPSECFQVAADELVLPDTVVAATTQAFPGIAVQPVITYLANTLSVGAGDQQRKIPYSTIVGVDSQRQLGPVLDDGGKPIHLADNEIVLNRWAADNLKAKVGDHVRVTFYEPESTHGRLREHEPAPVFKLRAIVELRDKNGKPTAAADPRLAPEMPGVTDRKSISDWDLPFELVEKVRPEDEKYWDEYRTTPKAFVSFDTAKRLWASRWGTISLLRLPAGATGANGGAERLSRAIEPSRLGMAVVPLKRLGLDAASGSTPFDVLFLAFSSFLIAAAVMLVALLFQLGIEQRSAEIGTLAAIGIERRRLAYLLGIEGILVAAVGGTIGVVAGVIYAAIVIFGLTHWWLAAISTPFIHLHVAWLSLVIGWFVGVVVPGTVIGWSTWKMTRVPAARLMAGWSGYAREAVMSSAISSRPKGFWKGFRWPVIRWILAVLAVSQCVAGFFMHGEEQSGVFFGSGASMLALFIGEIRMWLRQSTAHLGDVFSLTRLSGFNAARNPGRSALTIGLVASAAFLIVAVSAFRLDTGEGGTGGFRWMARSDLPIHYDLNTADGRRELGFSDAAERAMEKLQVYSVRLAAGEDASCLNLYQATQPRVLGVPQSLIQRGGFEWAGVEKRFADAPWTSLNADLEHDANGTPIVPAVLDLSTAEYGLHLDGVGARLAIQDSAGRPVTIQVVGLLANSVLQGNVVVSEANFLRMFPDTAGYRFFLIERKTEQPGNAGDAHLASSKKPTKKQELDDVADTLESALSDEGFDVADAREQLAQYLAVQNTYLSTFQSLGALGLLLGTFGLAVVQLRSVLERRGELALMRAGGFSRSRLTWLVVLENAVLLISGLVVGCVAAGVALIPQWLPHGASVPWIVLLALVGVIAAIGLLAGWLATRRVLAAPIVPALRGD